MIFFRPATSREVQRDGYLRRMSFGKEQMKIAIVRNEKERVGDKCLLESHKLNIWFKIFGPTELSIIESNYDHSTLIHNTKDRLFGKKYIHDEVEL